MDPADSKWCVSDYLYALGVNVGIDTRCVVLRPGLTYRWEASLATSPDESGCVTANEFSRLGFRNKSQLAPIHGQDNPHTIRPTFFSDTFPKARQFRREKHR